MRASWSCFARHAPRGSATTILRSKPSEALRPGIEALLQGSLSGAVVRPSVGQGNWAAVPWIAVLHPDVTTTTQHGVYPVLLFREDLAAVEVTIAQGVTDLKKSLGRREAVRELDRRATALRQDLEDLRILGFHLDADLELGPSQLARDYVASTVVHRRYEQGSISDSDVSEATAFRARGLWAPVAGRHAETAWDVRTGADVDPSPDDMFYVGQSARVPNFESGVEPAGGVGNRRRAAWRHCAQAISLHSDAASTVVLHALIPPHGRRTTFMRSWWGA